MDIHLLKTRTPKVRFSWLSKVKKPLGNLTCAFQVKQLLSLQQRSRSWAPLHILGISAWHPTH